MATGLTGLTPGEPAQQAHQALNGGGFSRTSISPRGTLQGSRFGAGSLCLTFLSVSQKDNARATKPEHYHSPHSAAQQNRGEWERPPDTKWSTTGEQPRPTLLEGATGSAPGHRAVPGCRGSRSSAGEGQSHTKTSFFSSTLKFSKAYFLSKTERPRLTSWMTPFQREPSGFYKNLLKRDGKS